MNFFEILAVFLALFISFLIGKYFVHHVGWWGVIPALIIGCGSVAATIWMASKYFDRRRMK